MQWQAGVNDGAVHVAEDVQVQVVHRLAHARERHRSKDCDEDGGRTEERAQPDRRAATVDVGDDQQAKHATHVHR